MRIINGTTTINASATTSASISISPAIVLANTWITYTVRGGNSNPGDSMVLYTLNTGSLVFNRQTAGTNTLTIEYSIISSTIFSVQHFSGTISATPTNLALSPTIDTSKTFPIIYAATGGSSFNSDEGLQIDLSSTQAIITCGTTPATIANLQVISSNIFSVQKGSFSFPSGSGTVRNITITAVNIAKTFLYTTNLYGSSNTTRLHEKIVASSLTSATNIEVIRTGVTTNNSGLVYAVSLVGDGSVSHSGLITFTSSTTPTSPAGDFAGSTQFDKTIPWIAGSSYSYAVNDITSDDNLGRCQVAAKLNSVSSGANCSISFQKSAATDVVRLHASLIYLPDSLDNPSSTLTGSQTDSSLINIRAKYDLNVTGNELETSLINVRAKYDLSATANELESSLINARAKYDLNSTSLDVQNTLIQLRAKYDLDSIGNDEQNSLIATRGVLPLALSSIENQDSLITLRAKLDLTVIGANEQNSLIQLRAKSNLGIIGLQGDTSLIEFATADNELILEDTQIETSLIEVRAVTPGSLISLNEQNSLIQLRAKSNLGIIGLQGDVSAININAQINLIAIGHETQSAQITFAAVEELSLLSLDVQNTLINVEIAQNPIEALMLQTALITVAEFNPVMEIKGVLVRTTDVLRAIRDAGIIE